MKLKDIMNLNRVDYSIVCKIMVWSPVHHQWFHPDQDDYYFIRDQKFLMKQEVVGIGLRGDSKDTIAIYLKDFGKAKNKKIAEKLSDKWE